jgi:phenylalanine dehydrogenase
VRAIVGSANNQLLDLRHGQVLQDKGILYAPDYIVNAGGLIQVADELYEPNKERVLRKTKAIYNSLLDIYKQAEEGSITTVEAANRFCEERIRARTRRNSFFSHSKRPKWNVRY